MEVYEYNIPDKVRDHIFEQVWEVPKNNINVYSTISQMEYENFKNVISQHKNILNVLDLGCGVGRAGIYLYNMINKSNKIKFHFCDSDTGAQGNGGTTTGNDYSSLEVTNLFINSNNVTNFEIIDFNKQKISTLPKQDIIMSMYSVGVHIPIEVYLNDILKIIDDDSIIILGIRFGGDPTNPCSDYNKYKEWFNNVNILNQTNTFSHGEGGGRMPGCKYLILNGPKVTHIDEDILWKEYNNKDSVPYHK